TAARQRMMAAGVPIVPGTDQPVQDDAAARKVAARLGYPILLKAAAGGGGKGMRVVEKPGDMASAFRAAHSEAESAFGDGRIYIEKYLTAPRHIEFQILADRHGAVVHLGERECSIQRRHQKIIEEAPSCVLDEALRSEMGDAAVKAAKACGYQNAGTIEFMLDSEGKFYFLEMNTRLQVEHPVTEMVTGLDLVKEQIRLAAGEKLGFSQEDVRLNGHAIECRIYAEDPENNFLPSIGKITFASPPAGPGIREDSGFFAGSEVSMYYDPLLSKLIAWGRDRQEAIARMRRALREYQIAGVETSIPFCLQVMHHDKFVSGKFDTHFIEKTLLEGSASPESLNADGTEAVAALAAVLFELENHKVQTPATPVGQGTPVSLWKLAHRKLR
ncbi:MAG: ATP-grasp domain-containing protein, partial [Calditrichaeota bacterium]